MNGVVKMSRTDRDKKGARGNSATGKKKLLKASLSHHSLPVDLTPGDAVTVKLVKSGYATQEFSYTVPTAAATVTKTMVSEMGTLSVTSTPTGATVIVGTETKISPCNFTLAPGTHAVTVSKTGYDTIADTVEITAGKTITKSYTLTPTLTPPCDSYGDVDDDGYVTQSDVDLIRSYIFSGWGAVKDKVSISESEFIHRADVDGNGYINMGDVGSVLGYIGGSIDTFPVCAKGALNVTTIPAGANVKVGTETKTSPCTFTLASGTHTVTITKTGYTTKTDTVVITAGVTTSKNYTLTPIHGTLSVTTIPTSATVKVGIDAKISPCNFTLAPGTHAVTVSKTGYETQTESVTITSGVTTTKSYTLIPSKAVITFKTLKEDTTELTGVSVYINGVLKGTT